MRKLSFALLALLLGAVTGVAAGLTESTNRTVNLLIPDDEMNGVGDNFTFTSAIHGIVPNLEIAGGYNGDLYVLLGHGANVAILLNRVGRTTSLDAGYGDAGFSITLSDAAPNGDIHFYRTVSNPQGGPLTGVWQPDGRDVDPLACDQTSPRTALLNVFTNESPNGDWSLAVFDAVTGFQATLVSWGLVFTYTTPAEIAVHNGSSIYSPELVNGQPTPVDFGTTGFELPLARQFTIANTGLSPLSLSNVIVPSGYLVLNLPTLPWPWLTIYSPKSLPAKSAYMP